MNIRTLAKLLILTGGIFQRDASTKFSIFYTRIISLMLLIIAFLKSLTKRYISLLTKGEHNGVSESIDSEDRNFSNVKLQQTF